MAPEIFLGEGYSSKVDVFSLGSCFFSILTGRFLFSAGNDDELLKKNRECKIEVAEKYLKEFTPLCRNLMLRMLSIDPSKRPTASEALQHPWF